MYNHIFVPLLALAVLCAAAYGDTTTCFNPFNNGDLATDYYVESSTPFPPPYPCSFSSTNVAYDPPKYSLSIGADATGVTCSEIVYKQKISFGYYECEMQPPGIAGTVTSCQVVSTVNSVYEAVYIKFFGNDTSRVYTGYFSSGNSNPTGPVPLEFDPTAKAHKYAFEWTSGYIRWYVDGKEVSSALGGKAIPASPNYFHASLLTEQTGFSTDNSVIPTDASVYRNFNGTPGAQVVATFTNFSYTPVIFIACDNSTGILPGNNGYSPYDPNECDLRSPFVIYDEALATGWSSQDSTTSDFANTNPVRTGSHAIRWDDTPMDARLFFLKQSGSFASTDYYSFEFWIYGNGYNGQQIGIQMIFADGSKSLQVKINDVLENGVQQWLWSRAVVPFTLFGVNPNVTQDVKGFVIYSISETFGGKIAIDNVALGYEYPMCTNATKNIYAEGPAKGVSDTMSWGVWNSKSTDRSHSGSYSIKWSMYDSGGVRLHTDSSVSSSTYQGVSFWLNTADLQGQDWTVAMTSPDSTTENNVAGAGPINLFMYYGGVLPPLTGQWVRIVIPFYQFGIVSGTNIDGILFSLSNTQYQGTLYIDDIDFIQQKLPKTSDAHSQRVGLLSLVVACVVVLAVL